MQRAFEVAYLGALLCAVSYGGLACALFLGVR